VLWRIPRRPWTKWIAAAYPFLTAFAVIVSGNHWVLDPVAAASALLGSWVDRGGAPLGGAMRCRAERRLASVNTAAHRIEANDDERAVLVHGDVHQWNALETGHRFAIGSPSGDQGMYGRIRVRLRGWCSSGRPPFVRGTPRRTSHT